MAEKVVLTIRGKGVTPDTILLGDLAYILDNFNRAVQAIAEQEGADPAEIQLSLVEIKEGSGEYGLLANNPARAHTATVVRAIERKDGTLLPARSRANVKNMHARARKNNWSMEIKGKSRSGNVYKTIVDPNAKLFKSPLTKGATSVLATIIKAGGEGRSRIAEIKLPDDTRLTAQVDTYELAQALGGLLYRQVELRGKAVWNSENWKIQSFHITEIGTYLKESSDPVAALARLHEASHGVWDTINVTSHFNDLRATEGGV